MKKKRRKKFLKSGRGGTYLYVSVRPTSVWLIVSCGWVLNEEGVFIHSWTNQKTLGSYLIAKMVISASFDDLIGLMKEQSPKIHSFPSLDSVPN